MKLIFCFLFYFNLCFFFVFYFLLIREDTHPKYLFSQLCVNSRQIYNNINNVNMNNNNNNMNTIRIWKCINIYIYPMKSVILTSVHTCRISKVFWLCVVIMYGEMYERPKNKIKDQSLIKFIVPISIYVNQRYNFLFLLKTESLFARENRSLGLYSKISAYTTNIILISQI